ncbi:MAG TPA: sigma-70 family RNA polymerase sigma factor [Chryseosolibacter sp.]|nr:sigma-70 family RNA polymerase sigma factor [Chryseosolibacter sp.]
MIKTDLTDQIAAERGNLEKLTRRFTLDHEESSDLVQETMLKALLYKDSFREDTNLKAWLFTIMRNTFINSYRKNKRIQSFCDNTKELYFLNVADNHTFSSPESGYEYGDLWKNVNELREELLVPFKLHTSGYKYQEIADHLRIPIGTVKNRIFQARKEIQGKLTGYTISRLAS